MKPIAPTIRALVLLAAMFVFTGCPVGESTSGPVETCSKAGERCKMGGGQLGVCSANTDGSIVCMSQH